MKSKKAKYEGCNRKTISNPYHHLSHKELLIKAGVTDLRNNYVIETLKDGRIVAKPLDENKKYKK